MTITVRSVAGQPYRTAIQAGRHTFYADVPSNLGGQDTAPSPHELLLGALGACTTMTLQMYAQRKGWNLQSVEVNLDENQDLITRTPVITKNIQIKGQLDSQQLQALKIVAEKCPVNKLIMGNKTMDSTLSVIA